LPASQGEPAFARVARRTGICPRRKATTIVAPLYLA
jgi:hypothetical protein